MYILKRKKIDIFPSVLSSQFNVDLHVEVDPFNDRLGTCHKPQADTRTQNLGERIKSENYYNIS